MDNKWQNENEKLLERYEQDAQARGLTRLTIKNFKFSVKKFSEFLGKRFVEVEKEDLSRLLMHLQEKELKPNTMKSFFTGLNSFFEYLELEDLIEYNPIPKFKKRYLRAYLKNLDSEDLRRQIISVEEMRDLVGIVSDPRDQAVIVLLAKTGVRCGELASLDVQDVDWRDNSIHVKKNGKRSNCHVYFDDEGQRVLRRWLQCREEWVGKNTGPLFVSYKDRGRMTGKRVSNIVRKYAKQAGLHRDGGRLDERFTAHNCRHFFTSWLKRNGMERDHIKILRGDSMNQTIDIYIHTDMNEVRQEYLRYVPRLMI